MYQNGRLLKYIVIAFCFFFPHQVHEKEAGRDLIYPNVIFRFVKFYLSEHTMHRDNYFQSD